MSQFRRNLMSNKNINIDLFKLQYDNSVFKLAGNHADGAYIGDVSFAPSACLTYNSTRANLLIERSLINNPFNWKNSTYSSSELNTQLMTQYSLIYIPQEIKGFNVYINKSLNYRFIVMIFNQKYTNIDNWMYYLCKQDSTRPGWQSNDLQIIFGETYAYRNGANPVKLINNNGNLFMWFALSKSTNASISSNITKEDIGLNIIPIY